jgi:hypothetical protein
LVQTLVLLHVPWHTPEQHSRSDEQAALRVLHAPAVEQVLVPSQNSEQHSEGSAQGDPALSQVLGLLQRLTPSTY